MNEMETLQAELAAARKENKRLVCQIEIESARQAEAFKNALTRYGVERKE